MNSVILKAQEDKMAWEVEDLNNSNTAEADSIIAKVEADHAESIRQEQEVIETLSEAVKRIEEANLWKTLLGLDVFAVGSARSEIIESANKKIRAFARQNLEKCVGIHQAEETTSNSNIPMAFDTEEIQALKILAAKVLKRDVTKAILSEYKPQVAQVTGIKNSNNIVQTVKNTTPQQKKRVQTKRPPGYIPPATGYVPPVQSSATITPEGLSSQTTMSSLVSQLIQQASGGNVLSQNTTPVDNTNDVNERF